MRIAFLFDSAPRSLDPLTELTRLWIRGLAESQHQLKVITAVDHDQPPALAHERIQWSQAMKTWSLFELPRLLKALLPFAPEIIHLVLVRPLRAAQIWGLGAALKSWAIPLVVSVGDQVKGAERWPFVDCYWSSKRHSHLPFFRHSPGATEPIENKRIYVPGPLAAHRDWRFSLNEIFHRLKLESETKWHLGWDWSEIPVFERLTWRERWSSETNRVLALGALSLTQQIGEMALASESRLDLLRSDTWTASLLRQNAPSARTRDSLTANFDRSINELARAYREITQLLPRRGPWHS